MRPDRAIIDRSRVARLWTEQGLSASQIAERLRCSTSRIDSIVNQLGLRKPGEHRKTYMGYGGTAVHSRDLRGA